MSMGGVRGVVGRGGVRYVAASARRRMCRKLSRDTPACGRRCGGGAAGSETEELQMIMCVMPRGARPMRFPAPASDASVIEDGNGMGKDEREGRYG